MELTMGYTHYFTLKNTKIQNGSKEQMMEALKKVIKKYDAIICKEYDEPGEDAELTKDYIRFNGIEDDGHETFYFGFTNKAKSEWNFCKTARKSYDLPVCECLLIIKAHYGDNVELSSDGFSCYDDKEIDGCWNQAIDNVKEMGYQIEYNILPRKRTPYFDATITTIHPVN